MRRRTLAAAALASLAVAAPALADPEEPNEKITDPKVALEPGREYTGAIDNLGDDDHYRVLGSGPVTLRATVVSDACPDDTPALHIELRSYDGECFQSACVGNYERRAGLWRSIVPEAPGPVLAAV